MTAAYPMLSGVALFMSYISERDFFLGDFPGVAFIAVRAPVKM